MSGLRINKMLWLTALVCFFVACKKPKEIISELPETLHNGFLTLNEGLFQQNNSTLTWFGLDNQQTVFRFFLKKTKLGLGDTGNDMKVYGSKIYIVINNSHILHVLDKKTGKLIKQLTLSNNNSGSSPRHIAFLGKYAFVCAFDGSVFKIDTSSISIQQIVQAGLNPEDICAFNNKLYVSNSGGLNYPNMDSTVSVIDPVSMQEITKIIVGKNPGSIVADESGKLWVSVRGDLSLNKGKLVKINPDKQELEASFDISCGSIASGNNLLYISNYNENQQSSNVYVFDPQSAQLVSNQFIKGVHFETLYGLQYLDVNGQGVIMAYDAKSYINQGIVYAFDVSGNLLFNYTSGLNPNATVFLP